jgi:small subunit ribosomal protein S20
MPHTKSAKKALRQSTKRRLLNRSQRSTLRTLIKKFIALVADAAAPQEEKETQFRLVSRRLDQAAARNLIHSNAASRTKSRLAARLNKAKSASAAPAQAPA